MLKYFTKHVTLYPEGISEEDVCVGQEDTYQLEHTPEKLEGIRYTRLKYKKKAETEEESLHSEILIAALPPEVIKNSMAGASLMAKVTVEKVADHMPIQRQKTALARTGIDIPYSTMMGWYNRTCLMLWPLYEALKKEVLSSGYIQMDETPIKVMDPDT
ncbi:Transposase [bacterium A37T11]|nr:Transposase [bacterium A37T11]